MPDIGFFQTLVSAAVGLASGFSASLLNEAYKRQYERGSLAVALESEVEHVLNNLDALQGRFSGQVEKRDRPQVMQFWSIDKHMAIYSANLGKIGVFDPDTTRILVKFYGGLRDTVESYDRRMTLLHEKDSSEEEILFMRQSAAEFALSWINRFALPEGDRLRKVLMAYRSDSLPSWIKRKTWKGWQRLFGRSRRKK